MASNGQGKLHGRERKALRVSAAQHNANDSGKHEQQCQQPETVPRNRMHNVHAKCTNGVKTVNFLSPLLFSVYLDRNIVQWCTQVKYLGLYLISGADFKIDLTAAKRKYYGCFNTIMPVVGNQISEIVALHLVSLRAKLSGAVHCNRYCV